MNLKQYFSESLLDRFRKLDEKIGSNDLRGPNITFKEDIEKTKKGGYFSEEANEYLDIQKRITFFLLLEVVEHHVDLENNFDVFLEINQNKLFPFNVLIKDINGKVFSGKPFSKYRLSQNPKDYIKQEVEEVKRRIEILKSL